LLLVGQFSIESVLPEGLLNLLIPETLVIV
jgi:hypothetical protein